MLHIKKLFFVCFLFSLSILSQEKFTVSGTVYDQNNNETLIGVSIYFPALNSGTTTNEYGFYSITVPEGSYKILVSYLGYSTIIETLNLSEKIVVTTELLTDARNIEHELNTLVQLIRQSDDYDSHHKERFMKAMEYKGNFIKNYKNGKSNRRKVDELYNRVLKEMPPERFHIPGEQP